tara:strand:+ start:507 stop:3854 length:3348 start_codon:yes stop_codon:yes gene_type:complete
MLDGVGTAKDYAARCKELGMQAAAVTDHGTMAGLFEFYNEMTKVGVKPILGNEMYCVEDMHQRGLTDEEKDGLTATEVREKNKLRLRSPHLLLLAENDIGLRNLFRLNYYANTEGYYGKPRIDLDLLEKHSEGIIATTTCVISNMARYLQAKQTDKMTAWFDRMLEIFGEDNLFIELHPHDLDIQKDYNVALIELFRKKYENVKCVLANDVHVVLKEHDKVHDFLWNISTDGKFDEAGVHTLYLASEEEMRGLWYDNGYGDLIADEYLEEAIESTKHIASRCNAKLDMETLKEPKFETPDGFADNREYIVHQLKKGMQEKLEAGQIKEEDIPEYTTALKKELDLVADKGYIDYFLITQDFCKFAYDNDILMSPGRGSASGALLCWLLGITHLNPIKYNLFFERFMNPTRIKEPDIDNDFSDKDREKVKEYVASKWGDANIASVCAYARYSVNTLFRDLAKHKGLPFQESNKIAKTISGHISLNKDMASFSEIMNEKPEVRKFVQEMDKDEATDFVQTIDVLNGNARNQTIAAGGVIISSSPLYDMMPLRKTKDDVLVTEWQIDELAKMKFLKIDMLGISTLSVLKDVMDKVGMNIADLYNMPLDREALSEEEQVYYDKAFQLLCEGQTFGVFQFAGSNITRVLQQSKPKTIEDIAAVNAIYRPGVIKMGALDAFIRRKNGQEDPTNDHHPMFEEILEPTQGIMIYQEQFIQMFSMLGLSFGEGDILRKTAESLDKKKCNAYLEEHLYSSPEKLILSLEETKKVADKLIENAGYLFNKSHAISYSILAYWTSYFKAKYPAEFIEVLCNHSADDHDEVALCLSMARDLLDNPEVTLGNINNFSLDFKVTKDEFMVGLLGVKGLGKTVLNKIKNHMPSAGGWLDYTEFLQDNFQHKMISANDLKMLITLGLFDGLVFCGREYTRKALVDITDIYYNLFNLPKRDLKKVCEKVFDDDSLTFKDLVRSDRLESLIKVFNINTEEEYGEVEVITNELEYVGFRVTENRERWEHMTSVVKDMGLPHISDFDDDAESHDHVWLTVRTVEMLKTKKGKPYANVRADDGSSFRVWHNKLQYHTDDLIPGKVLIVKLNADTFGRSIAWDRGALVGEEKILELRQQL